MTVIFIVHASEKSNVSYLPNNFSLFSALLNCLVQELHKAPREAINFLFVFGKNASPSVNTFENPLRETDLKKK